jgi:PhnB protein
MTRPIPDGFHTVTPHLAIRDCEKALSFYEKAFGAEILTKSPAPNGKLMHALFKIGDSLVMAADEHPEMGESYLKTPAALGGTTVLLTLYVPDVDASHDRAVKAGCTAGMPPADMFWGDRYSQVRDPFGHSWAFATHKEDLTPAQIAERFKKWMAEMASAKK